MIGIALASVSSFFVLGGKSMRMSTIEVSGDSVRFFNSRSSMVFKSRIEIGLRDGIESCWWGVGDGDELSSILWTVSGLRDPYQVFEILAGAPLRKR